MKSPWVSPLKILPRKKWMAYKFTFRHCIKLLVLARTFNTKPMFQYFLRIVGGKYFFVHILQIYISSLHQIVCARKDINTKPMFQYFQQNCWGKILWHVYIRYQNYISPTFCSRKACTKEISKIVGKPSNKNIENRLFLMFSATWLIRYVKKLHRIFTSSKPRFTGENFLAWNKNWQCTAITTLRIKQKQAQFTPDQNSTNTSSIPMMKKICTSPKF